MDGTDERGSQKSFIRVIRAIRGLLLHGDPNFATIKPDAVLDGLIRPENPSAQPPETVTRRDLKVSLLVGVVFGVAIILFLGMSVYANPSSDIDPGIFFVMSPIIFLFWAVIGFGIGILVCVLRRVFKR